MTTIELQQFLTIRYEESNKTEAVCRTCYKQFKTNGTKLRIMPSKTPNSKCDVCERLSILKKKSPSEN